MIVDDAVTCGNTRLGSLIPSPKPDTAGSKMMQIAAQDDVVFTSIENHGVLIHVLYGTTGDHISFPAGDPDPVPKVRLNRQADEAYVGGPVESDNGCFFIRQKDLGLPER